MNAKYVNREVSWLDFNYRVLDQAYDLTNPLAERLKFIAITANNLDEFYRIKIAGLDLELDEVTSQAQTVLTDSRNKLNKVKTYAKNQIKKIYQTNEYLVDKLSTLGIRLSSYKELDEKEKDYYKSTFLDYFKDKLIISDFNLENLSFVDNNVITVICESDTDQTKRYLISLKSKKRVLLNPERNSFILSEDFLYSNLDKFYSKRKITPIVSFRILRNADLYLSFTHKDKYLNNLKSVLKKRKIGQVIRLDITSLKNVNILPTLKRIYSLDEKDISIIKAPLDLSFWFELYQTELLDQKYFYPPKVPIEVKELSKDNIFETIIKRDHLVYHPYVSYNSFLNFLETSVNDPYVKSIKQTFYRLCDNSPVIDLLIKGSEMGKEVVVFIELRARFDEERNLNYYNKLTDAGCKVIIFFEKKVHAKTCLVKREINGKINYFAHLSTGNYNKETVKVYSDLSLFTANQDICKDISSLFEYLMTGKSVSFNKLFISPINLRGEFLNLIQKEEFNARDGKRGLIVAKINSLVDSEIINALYRASEAGVVIKLIVRGICSLNPNYKSAKNIEVISIVGRYLEHSRIYYFYNNGDEKFLISSADWMSRNLDRRVEVAVEIEDSNSRNLLKTILSLNLNDNLKSSKMIKQNTYISKNIVEEGINSQDILYDKFLMENQDAKTCDN
ncbi:MAG: polyphosphate kinase 1 [Clostridia bacterium]